MKMKTILVAEDEPEVRNYLEMALRCQGYAVESAQDGEEVLSCLSDGARQISLVLLDIMMPRKDGMTTLREIRRRDRELPIIMLSGASSPLNVVEAIKGGATDFLGKPVSHQELGKAIEKAMQFSSGAPETAELPPPSSEEPFFSGSAHMKKIQRALRQIADSEVPVLLQGESGVGKEVLARQLHAQSRRAGKPFLKINCAALPSELLESELFGYERGAFTGAFKNKPGKFELADEGTILLDEIGDMDFKLQAKLLQVLQDHEFQRLGGKETVRVNVRVLAATHCDLERAIREGRFREDLYYRLNVISLQVPALRQRKEEIMPLAGFFLRKHASPRLSIPEIPPALRHALLAHDWPGNIRELENVMRRYLVFRDPEMLAEELRFKTRRKEAEWPAASAARPPEPAAEPWPGPGSVAEETADTAEAEAVPATLASTSWDSQEGPLDPDYEAALRKMRELAAEEAAVSLPQPPSGAGQEPSPKPRASILEKVDEARRQAEVRAILAALNTTRWNRKKAAALLNMDYKALLYKMKKLAIGDKPPSVETLAAEGTLEPGSSILEKVGQARREAESEAILAALATTHWNRKQAAALLNIDYKALLYKMKKLGIGEKQPAGSLARLSP